MNTDNSLKLLKNHGELHNRVTRRMYIEPFCLGECETYFRANNIVMTRYQMVESYMIVGDSPYYLSLMNKGIGITLSTKRE